MLVKELLEGTGLFQRTQILALDVLDERHRHRLPVVHIAHNRRHGVQAGALRGTPAAFAGDDLVAAGGPRAHDHRLDHALRANGLRQFVNAFFADVAARLIAASVEAIHGQFRRRERFIRRRFASAATPSFRPGATRPNRDQRPPLLHRSRPHRQLHCRSHGVARRAVCTPNGGGFVGAADHFAGQATAHDNNGNTLSGCARAAYAVRKPAWRNGCRAGVIFRHLAADAGWVSVGGPRHRGVRRGDAAALVAESGCPAYPEARRVMVTADGGGSNGTRSRLWKVELRKQR